MFGFKTKVNLLRARAAWRKKNGHNSTWLSGEGFGLANVSIGDYSYGPIHVNTSVANPRLEIGSFCSIAGGVTFLIGNGHPLDHFSTFPYRVKMLGEGEPEAIDKGGVVLGDDVWIGYGATILDGVHIGRGGGRRGRSRCHQGRGALHDRGGRSREAYQEAIRSGCRGEIACVRLFAIGQAIRRGSSRAALPPVGRACPRGAVR